MKKNMMAVLLILTICFSVTGCGNAIPEMSAEDMDMVTEYAAGLLLKYNSNYEPRLLNDQQLEEEQKIQAQIAEDAARLAAREAEKEAAKAREASDTSSDAQDGASIGSPEYTDVADFLGMEGFSVSYNGVEYTQKYPQDGEVFFSITATTNCDLAVIRLFLVNETDEDRDVNLMEMEPKFKASFNDGSYHRALSTILDDDFSNYTGTVPARGSVPLVVIVDLPKDEAVNINTLSLYVKSGDLNAQIRLQ